MAGDPYSAYNFRLSMDGRYVASMSNASLLDAEAETTGFRAGSGDGVDRKLPGATSFEAVTLERGIIHDADFRDWASSAVSPSPDAVPVRRNLILELCDELGRPVLRHELRDCWVSMLTGPTSPVPGEDGIAVEMMRIETAGYRRVDLD